MLHNQLHSIVLDILFLVQAMLFPMWVLALQWELLIQVSLKDHFSEELLQKLQPSSNTETTIEQQRVNYNRATTHAVHFLKKNCNRNYNRAATQTHHFLNNSRNGHYNRAVTMKLIISSSRIQIETTTESSNNETHYILNLQQSNNTNTLLFNMCKTILQQSNNQL